MPLITGRVVQTIYSFPSPPSLYLNGIKSLKKKRGSKEACDVFPIRCSVNDNGDNNISRTSMFIQISQCVCVCVLFLSWRWTKLPHADSYKYPTVVLWLKQEESSSTNSNSSLQYKPPRNNLTKRNKQQNKMRRGCKCYKNIQGATIKQNKRSWQKSLSFL